MHHILGNDKDWNEYMRKKFEVINNPEKEYQILSSFNHGGSGASVQIVKHIKTGTNAILKIYKNLIYNQSEKDTKPLREIYTTFVMSGTEGFPLLYDFGKLINSDGVEHLYLISELVSGETLTGIDLRQFDSKQMTVILLQLINLLFVARSKLGTFIHNDLHPDNIFIDIKKCYSGKIDFGNDISSAILSPKVTIIDFDTAVSNRYQKYNIEHPESTVLSFINKFVGSKYNDYFMERSSIGKTDIQMWNLYYMLISILNWEKNNKNPITDIDIHEIIKNSKLCRTLDDCISHPYITRQLISKCSRNKGGYLQFKCL